MLYTSPSTAYTGISVFSVSPLRGVFEQTHPGGGNWCCIVESKEGFVIVYFSPCEVFLEWDLLLEYRMIPNVAHTVY